MLHTSRLSYGMRARVYGGVSWLCAAHAWRLSCSSNNNNNNSSVDVAVRSYGSRCGHTRAAHASHARAWLQQPALSLTSPRVYLQRRAWHSGHHSTACDVAATDAATTAVGHTTTTTTTAAHTSAAAAVATWAASATTTVAWPSSAWCCRGSVVACGALSSLLPLRRRSHKGNNSSDDGDTTRRALPPDDSSNSSSSSPSQDADGKARTPDKSDKSNKNDNDGDKKKRDNEGDDKATSNSNDDKNNKHDDGSEGGGGDNDEGGDVVLDGSDGSDDDLLLPRTCLFVLLTLLLSGVLWWLAQPRGAATGWSSLCAHAADVRAVHVYASYAQVYLHHARVYLGLVHDADTQRQLTRLDAHYRAAQQQQQHEHEHEHTTPMTTGNDNKQHEQQQPSSSSVVSSLLTSLLPGNNSSSRLDSSSSSNDMELPVIVHGTPWAERALMVVGTLAWLAPLVFVPLLTVQTARMYAARAQAAASAAASSSSSSSASSAASSEARSTLRAAETLFRVEHTSRTRFRDVAGMREAKQEVTELVQFLRQPDAFTRLGATIPTGALLLGPPGTGKTLLARAVAGESGVGFIAACGSDFVELYVGMGALRVRKLFEQARKQRCIVYIDEIDAIGLRRQGSGHGERQEQEHTLNELLTQLDCFKTSERGRVMVLASTNAALEALDPALVRPGRFDRLVHIDTPVLAERVDIFRAHLCHLKLLPDAERDVDTTTTTTTGGSAGDAAAAVAAATAATSADTVSTQQAQQQHDADTSGSDADVAAVAATTAAAATAADDKHDGSAACRSTRDDGADTHAHAATARAVVDDNATTTAATAMHSRDDATQTSTTTATTAAASDASAAATATHATTSAAHAHHGDDDNDRAAAARASDATTTTTTTAAHAASTAADTSLHAKSNDDDTTRDATTTTAATTTTTAATPDTTTTTTSTQNNNNTITDAFDVEALLAGKSAEARARIDAYAQRMSALCPGFVGADVANVCNEAAILAARESASHVALSHLERSIDRVLAGIEHRSRALSPFERRVVAHHEAGHAVAGWHLRRADPLMKVSIVPRSGSALGYAQYLPSENDSGNRTARELRDAMAVALGGRIAEQLFFGHLSTGASDDLRKVCQMAYTYVASFGRAGLSRRATGSRSDDNNSNSNKHSSHDNDKAAADEHEGDKAAAQATDDGAADAEGVAVYAVPGTHATRLVRPFGSKTANELDAMAKELVDDVYASTWTLLQAHRAQMAQLAQHLLQHEVLTYTELVQYLGTRPDRTGDRKADVA